LEEDTSSAELSKPQPLSKQHKTLIIIFSLVTTLFGVLILSLILYTWDREQFANGVVLEIPLGHFSLEEARGELEHLKNELYKRPVQFVSDDKTFLITMEELGLTYTYREPLQKAYLIGREGTLLEKASSKYKARLGIAFQPTYHWNDRVLADTLSERLSSLNIPAQDACFSINPDNSLQIVPETLGRQIDLDALLAGVKKQTRYEASQIPLTFNTVTPAITKAELETLKTDQPLSSYTTHFNSNQKERSYNIKLASQAIDAQLLKPREVFSFNNTVGPRTVEAGYQVAIVIEGTEFVPGLGGGVCQVSSTLYNAVRLASSSLSVVERSPHSLPVTYVPPGQDATVAYPVLDFKFRNDSDDLLLIRSFVTGNSVAFSIYGQ